jgi:hypothetical protein
VKSIKWLPSLVGFTLLSCAGAASALIVDNFDSGFGSIVNPGQTTIVAPTALGGSHELEVFTPIAGGGVPSLAVVNTAQQELQFQGSQCVECRASVTWDGNGAGLPGVMLDGNAFALRFMDLDSDLLVRIQVFDEIGGVSSLSLLIDSFTGPDPVIEYFRFADFLGNANFNAVDELSLSFNSGPTPSFPFMRLDSIVTTVAPPITPPPTGVPSPGSLALVLAGVAAFALTARRRVD